MDLKFFEKDFVSSKHFYQKSFCNPKLAMKILKDPIQVSSIIDADFEDLLSCRVLLNKDQEYQFFRKYNYLKYRIKKIAKDKKLGKEKKIFEINKRLKITRQIKDVLFRCNSRLIVKPIFRYYKKHDQEYEVLFSNGCDYLIKCIDYFDYRRGYKFSTYFVNVLNTNFYRDNKKIKRATGNFELVSYNEEGHKDNYREVNQKYNEDFVSKMLKHQSLIKTKNYNIRKNIIVNYFGLNGKSPKKQSEIAKDIGMHIKSVNNIIRDSIGLLQKANISYDPLI